MFKYLDNNFYNFIDFLRKNKNFFAFLDKRKGPIQDRI